MEMVIVHHIICKDTIDGDVMKALRKKKSGQDELINAVKARIGGAANDKERAVTALLS